MYLLVCESTLQIRTIFLTFLAFDAFEGMFAQLRKQRQANYQYEMGTLPPGEAVKCEITEFDAPVIKTEPPEEYENSCYEENVLEIDNVMTEAEIKEEPLCGNEDR